MFIQEAFFYENKFNLFYNVINYGWIESWKGSILKTPLKRNQKRETLKLLMKSIWKCFIIIHINNEN